MCKKRGAYSRFFFLTVVAVVFVHVLFCSRDALFFFKKRNLNSLGFVVVFPREKQKPFVQKKKNKKQKTQKDALTTRARSRTHTHTHARARAEREKERFASHASFFFFFLFLFFLFFCRSEKQKKRSLRLFLVVVFSVSDDAFDRNVFSLIIVHDREEE